MSTVELLHVTVHWQSDLNRPFGTVSDIDDTFFFVLAIVLVVVPSIEKKRGMLLVTRHALGYPWCFSFVPRAWHSCHLDSH